MTKSRIKCSTMCHANEVSARRSSTYITGTPKRLHSSNPPRAVFLRSLDARSSCGQRPRARRSSRREHERHEEPSDRCNDAEPSIEVRDRRDRLMHVPGLDVAARGERQTQAEESERDPERGAHRHVAWYARAADVRRDRGGACLNPWPKKNSEKSTAGSDTAGQNGDRYRVPPEVHRECRPEAERAFNPADVPIRLRRTRHLPRTVWAPKPDRINLYGRSECDRDRGHREHQCDRFGAYCGKSGEPTTLSSVRPGPGNCVCFWRQISATCKAMSEAIAMGNR